MKADSRTEFTLTKIAAFGAGFAIASAILAYLLAASIKMQRGVNVSAATFDSQLAPATSTIPAFDIGSSNAKWRSLFLAQDMNVDSKVIWASGGTATVNNSISFLRTGFLSVAIRVLAANEKLLITMTSSTAPGFPELTGVNNSTKVLMTPLRNTAVPTNEIILVTARGKTPDTIELEVKNVSSTAASVAETRNFSYLMIR